MYLVLRPVCLTRVEFYITAVIAAIEVFYQVPYYKALRETDTSIVTSLFSIEKIFIPVLAYFIIGERLAFIQYLGFGVVIVSLLLTTISKKTFKPNKALYYMLAVSIFLAIDSVLQKYSLEKVDWKSFYFWLMLLSIPYYFILYLIQSSARSEVRKFLKAPFSREYIPLYGQNIATWIAGGISTLALSILPVTISKAVGSIHSVIVHLIAAKGYKRLDLDKQEKLSPKRIFLFLLLAIGIVMIFA
jgi:drug/metabolite transporter (DMT)-like permease